MKLLVINGVNINMLGIREPDIYGKQDYKYLIRYIKAYAKAKKVGITIKQSNQEGKIVDMIQRAYRRYDGIIINAGAYTHTSIAILDALKAVGIPTVEVHLTDVSQREEYRRFSFVSEYAVKVIKGKGIEGYGEAIDYFL